jgi:hypothetical protein
VNYQTLSWSSRDTGHYRRGIFAVEDIPAGAMICHYQNSRPFGQMPQDEIKSKFSSEDLALWQLLPSIKNLGETYDLPSYFNDSNSIENVDDFQHNICASLYLLHHVGRPTSPWAPWLTMLHLDSGWEPANCLAFNPDGLALLKGTTVLQYGVDPFRRLYNEVYTWLAKSVFALHPDMFAAEHFSEAKFRWAYSQIVSRTHSSHLLPLLDMLNCADPGTCSTPFRDGWFV